MKKPQPSRCEQLGVCQAYGTCTRCLVASQRHPFAPGVIEPEHPAPPRSFVIAVWVLVALALTTMGALLWVTLDMGGLIPHLWLLVA